MAKWHGKICFSTQNGEIDPENRPGVYGGKQVVKEYYGNMLQRRRRSEESNDSINDDVQLDNTLSILADSFMTENYTNIVYVTIFNKPWKVTEATIEYPRIELTLGGLYNGKTS